MTVAVETILLLIASGGALFNAWQISRLSGRVEHLSGRVERLSGRVDSIESTLQTVVTVLASGGVRPAALNPRVEAEPNV